jgi:hypothetical protein
MGVFYEGETLVLIHFLSVGPFLGHSYMPGHRTDTPPSQPPPGGLTASLKILPLSDG